MKIISIKFKEHFIPNCSGGTGYSEPDIFEVETDVVTKDIYVDVWYIDKKHYRSIFNEAIHEQLEDYYKHFSSEIDVIVRNKDEAFEMYLKALKEK